MISPGLPCRGALLCAAVLFNSPVFLALAGDGGQAEGCAWELRLMEPRTQRELLDVPLSPGDPTFSLSYTHSVFHTEVVSEYQVRESGIVQVRETFTDPGYGMESSPDDVKGRLEQIDGHLRMELERPIPNLVVRVQRAQNNRITGLESMDLSQLLGDGPIAIRPTRICSPEG
ncbi:hypothetical protein NA8A_19073 [Nitratireductor indicus C115]|uniref:DUF1850 domain-containing protein n=2 Tax=Nitratireductor indicus TaxID=721133 RepID=K2MZR2_9HYPH|nr:hypothetical protein NA8A_19073 [Nitratireductor indicus C115]SFQ75903.1 protein of unknown function [Nitratireductor indicus]